MSIKSSTKSEKKDDLTQQRAKVVSAALELAAARGWQYVSMRDIARQCDLPMARLFDLFEDKTDILVALGRIIDREVLENLDDYDDNTTPRERLFDILMNRYEALFDRREGILAILEAFKCDPKQIVLGFPHLCRSMSWMLESAGVETDGVKGAVKVTALTALYTKILLQHWVKDEQADMPKTMAALDRALEKAEQAANTFGF